MKKRTGIITGAGKGIGFSTTKYMLSKNYRIIAITKTNTSKLLKLKKKYKDQIIVIIKDLSNINYTTKLINKLFLEYEITFLVNNAGKRSRSNIVDLDENQINNIMNINFFSPFNITREYLKNCNKKYSHSIVSITSIVGPRGFLDLSNYAASKGALESSMRSLAIEWAKKNIRINCIAPGFINTSFARDFKTKRKKLYNWTLQKTPMNRWGEAEEVSSVIEFLISDLSSYITGTTIYVDGGWTAT